MSAFLSSVDENHKEANKPMILPSNFPLDWTEIKE